MAKYDSEAVGVRGPYIGHGNRATMNLCSKTCVVGCACALLLAGVASFAQQTPSAAIAHTTTGPSAASSSLTPYFIRSRRFSLPIQVTQTSPSVIAVQLYVSLDGGASWQLYAQQPITVAEFAFQAPQDGNYWFASKTLDDRNGVFPEGPPRAEQWVVVDTRAPVIRLGYELGRTGEVILHWQVTDESLDTASLHLEYRDGILSAWQPLVDVSAHSQRVSTQQPAGPPTVTGQYAWQPQVSSRVIEIRLSAADRAGNVSREVQRVFLPRAQQQGELSRAGDGARSAGGANSTAAPPHLPSSGQMPNPVAPFDTGVSSLDVTPRAVAPQTPAPRVPGPAPAPLASDTNPHQPPAVAPPAGTTTPVATPPVATPSIASSNSIQTASDKAPGPVGNILPSGKLVTNPFYDGQARVPGTVIDQARETPSAISADRATATGSANQQTTGFLPDGSPDVPGSESSLLPGSASPGSIGSSWPTVPAGQVVKMTRNRRFQLEYDLESAVANAVKEVQLWGTRDGGVTWQKWGIDHDRQSPFDVEVDQDGMYGFRVVLVAANGLASEVPRSGAPADLWVGVDSNPPRAEITAVEYGTGSRVGQIEIRWVANDERLGPHPVTLSFSTHRDGPWTTIVAGIGNTGQYYWLVGQDIPAEVFIRLDVQDEAGNCTSAVTVQAIRITGLVPRARIRNIKSEGNSSPQ